MKKILLVLSLLITGCEYEVPASTLIPVKQYPNVKIAELWFLQCSYIVRTIPGPGGPDTVTVIVKWNCK